MLPSILKKALADSNAQQSIDDTRDDIEEDPITAPPVSRLDRFYTTTKECVLSDQVLEIIKTAFTKQLSKDIWSDLMEKYPQIKGTENVLVAPTMETGTKEYISTCNSLQQRSRECHILDHNVPDDHITGLIHAISGYNAKISKFRFTKVYSRKLLREKKPSKRQKLNKLIIFGND